MKLPWVERTIDDAVFSSSVTDADGMLEAARERLGTSSYAGRTWQDRREGLARSREILTPVKPQGGTHGHKEGTQATADRGPAIG